MSSRNLQLSNDNGDLSVRLRGEQESAQMLRERLATVSKEQEEAAAMVSWWNMAEMFTCGRSDDIDVVSGATDAGHSAAAAEGLDTAEAAAGQRAELLQGEGRRSSGSTRRMSTASDNPHTFLPQLDRHSHLEAELSSVMLKLQRAEQDQERLQRETEDRNAKVRP